MMIIYFNVYVTTWTIIDMVLALWQTNKQLQCQAPYDTAGTLIRFVAPVDELEKLLHSHRNNRVEETMQPPINIMQLDAKWV